MRRHHFLALWWGFMQFFPLYAGTVDGPTARRAAIAWLNTSPAFVRSDLFYTPATTMQEVWDENQTQVLAYVLNLEPSGFIVVAPDDRIQPIIAYSETSRFSAQESLENTLLSILRKDVATRFEALAANEVEPILIGAAATAWNDARQMVSPSGQLLFKPVVSTAYAAEYGPYLSSEWGQSTDGWGQVAFNYDTPNHYVCGCVATAMGQILNYYQWPVTGTGSHSYTWNNGVDPSQVLSVDFGSTTYDWVNILDVYHDGGKSLTERQAVGELVYHCGVAVDMDYASDGSGAYTSHVAAALSDYFRAQGTWVNNTGDFYTQLETNIAYGRLAELSISGAVGGHAVVVDGFRDTGGSDEYHLNMGWSSSSDAWYILPNITSSPSFNTVSGAVLDILPTPDMDDPGTTTTATSLTPSWDVSARLDANYYELKKLYIPVTSPPVFDGAEGGMGDWTVDGYWGQSSATSNTGSYAFLGQLYRVATGWDFSGTMTYNPVVSIQSTTALEYYWAGSSAVNYQLRLEISVDDGDTWTALKSHDGVSSVSWAQVQVSTSDLSAYVGELALFRFVVAYLGGSINYGESIGLYIDDFTISNGRLGAWATVSSSLPGTSESIPTTGNGDYYFQVRAYCDDQWWNWSDIESVTVSSALVQAKVFLEGAYDTGTHAMTTSLNSGGYLPLSSPYADGHVIDAIPNSDIVDWVLVELRTTKTGSAVASHSALLHKDGRIVADDGSTNQIQLDAPAGDYYIVIRHRNHLAIMSDELVTLSASSSTLYDFTTGTDKVEGGDAALLESGVYGMYGGDANESGVVTFADKDPINLNVDQHGYYSADTNLTGIITFADKDPINKNVDKSSHL